MRKSEVYSWRVSPALKTSLEEAARRGGRSISQLLDEIVASHLAGPGGGSASDAEEQRRLHESAARLAGRIAGRNPERAASAGRLVRSRLRRLRGR